MALLGVGSRLDQEHHRAVECGSDMAQRYFFPIMSPPAAPIHPPLLI